MSNNYICTYVHTYTYVRIYFMLAVNKQILRYTIDALVCCLQEGISMFLAICAYVFNSFVLIVCV